MNAMDEAGGAPTGPVKLRFDRDAFMAECAMRASEWTDADRMSWEAFAFGATGLKVLGALQLNLSSQGGRALAIRAADPNEIARQLAVAQGTAIGVEQAIDLLLDLTQESSNV